MHRELSGLCVTVSFFSLDEQRNKLQFHFLFKRQCDESVGDIFVVSRFKWKNEVALKIMMISSYSTYPHCSAF